MVVSRSTGDDLQMLSERVRSTCQVTIEAVMYEARLGGPTALLCGGGLERLLRCDPDAREQIFGRLSTLWGKQSAREVMRLAVRKGVS